MLFTRNLVEENMKLWVIGLALTFTILLLAGRSSSETTPEVVDAGLGDT